MSKPIRRNVAHLSQVERDAFINAIKQADSSKFFVDGVSYWDKQDHIHQGTHVHGQRNFMPWHRELCNRFEALLQEIDPSVALHYWDWTEDPRSASDGNGGTVDLFTAATFGSGSGRAGAPFNTFDNGGTFAGSRDDTGNPADPPQEITRNVGGGGALAPADNTLISASDGLPQSDQWGAFDDAVHAHHDFFAHDFIGGTLSDPHASFEDPFVFLMHSNLDRLWAMWQFQPGQEWRLDPSQTYGDFGSDPDITEYLEPWSGTVHFGDPVPPWDPADPNNQIVYKSSKHASVVQPPCYDTMPTSVVLDSPTSGAPIIFQDVPEDVETVRGAVFVIRSCHDVELTITAGPGAPFGKPLGDTVVVPYNDGLLTYGYVWVSYKGTDDGDTANGSITIECDETGESWTIPITANTIAKPKVASVMVLDKSGSMAWASGIPGKTRLQVLKEAAPKFVYLLGDEDGIGIVSFDQDAYPVMGVKPAGSLGAGVGRGEALGHIGAHDEDGGATSIGDGIALGHSTVDPVTGYDYKALVVLTDGQENEPQYIADVSGILDERVYAIGLGRADQLDTAKLDAITSGSGGFTLMTGDLGTDDQFRLSKYFIEILAGVKNTEIVVDPESSVVPGTKHRIPFVLNENDFGSDVILLSPWPQLLHFGLETPDGELITPANVGTVPGAELSEGDLIHFYRVTMPALVNGKKAQAGLWHALVSIDDKGYKEFLTRVRRSHENDKDGKSALASATAHGVPYNLSVQALSNLHMNANVTTSTHEPGAVATLRAVLTETDLPVDHRATVRVELTRPDGTMALVYLSETEPGVFENTAVLAQPGMYQMRFLAEGSTRRGTAFTRTALRTAGIAYRADHQPPVGTPGSHGHDWCKFLRCLLEDESAIKRLGLNPKHLDECLKELCGPKKTDGPATHGRAVSGKHHTSM